MIRSLKATLSNIKANKQVCFASISSMAIALSILGLFLFIFINLSSFLSVWSNQVQLVVYLNDRISNTNRSQLESIFSGEPAIEKIDYVSRDMAWKNFEETFSAKSDFLNDLDFNPLPASFNLKFKHIPNRLEYIRQFADKIKIQRGVESVDYGGKWIARFEAFIVFLQIFLLALGGIMSFGLLLIVSNTIKLSVYSRKEEIELMLLMGATPRYIKVPYLFEGMLQGLLGSILALGIIKVLQLYLQYEFQGSLESITRGIDFQFITTPYIQIVVLASVLISLFGSYLSINHFLRSINK